MWSEAVRAGLSKDKSFAERIQSVSILHVDALIEYFHKIMPQLQNRRAVLRYRPDRVLHADLIFEELGRLAILLLMLQKIPETDEVRAFFRDQLIGLTSVHTGCRLPLYDGQTIDLTLVFAALMGESDWSNSNALLRDVTERLRVALELGQYLPVDTDLLEDAVALNVTGDADSREYFETSSLVPALATVAALLGDEESLSRLREEIGTLLGGVTLERWFPGLALETLSASRTSDRDFGVSRAITGPRATVQEEKCASLNPPEGAAEPRSFQWYGTSWTILAAMSARVYRHPVPTWFLAEYAQP
jgi:hypothetical protein